MDLEGMKEVPQMTWKISKNLDQMEPRKPP